MRADYWEVRVRPLCPNVCDELHVYVGPQELNIGHYFTPAEAREVAARMEAAADEIDVHMPVEPASLRAYVSHGRIVIQHGVEMLMATGPIGARELAADLEAAAAALESREAAPRDLTLADIRHGAQFVNGLGTHTLMQVSAITEPVRLCLLAHSPLSALAFADDPAAWMDRVVVSARGPAEMLAHLRKWGYRRKAP